MNGSWSGRIGAIAGVAFAVFIALCVAVALLGFSLTRHLRTARSNAEQGVFGPTDQSENHS